MIERRLQQRYNINSLEYITFSGGNGGIIVDICHGGIGVQTVAALQPSTTVQFSVVLPEVRAHIEGSAHVMWVTHERQAGLQFAELTHPMWQSIAEWIRSLTKQANDSGPDSAEQIQAGPSAAAASPQPPSEVQVVTPGPKESDDWTQVASAPVTVPDAPESNDGRATPDLAPGDLAGPFALSEKAIENCVKQKCWGLYMVGSFESNRFLVKRVGRSSDIANELYDYVGEYEAFKFVYCPSEKKAFQQECELYHRLRPAKNKSHPRKPPDEDWDCPVCHGF